MIIAAALLAVATGSQASTALRCSVLVVDVAARQPVFAEDVTRANCRADDHMVPVVYDRVQSRLVAREDLSVGTYVGRLVPHRRPAIRTGDMVVITARVGPVVIQRSVRALQDARTGEAFFVRDEDGRVFIAPAIADGVND